MGYINGSLGEVIGFEEDDENGLLPKVKLTDGTTLLVAPETWSIENEAGKVIASFNKFHFVWRGRLPFIKAKV